MMSIRFVYDGFDHFRSEFTDHHGSYDYDFNSAPTEVFDTVIAVYRFLNPKEAKEMPETLEDFEFPNDLVSYYDLFEVENVGSHHRYAEAILSINYKISEEELKKISENKELIELIEDAGIQLIREKTTTEIIDWD